MEWYGITVWNGMVEQGGGTVWNSGTVEQYSGTVWNSMVEQCGTMWYSVVEQWNSVEECDGREQQWNSVMEQCGGTLEQCW